MTYTDSHIEERTVAAYEQTYQRGYYRAQWEHIEAPLLAQLFADLRDSGDRLLVDLACGTGRILQLAEGHFPTTVGVDVSASMLAVASARCPRSLVIRGDVEQFSLSKPADVVTAFRFFLNAEPDLRRRALACANRILRPGGHLLVNIHVSSSSILGAAYRVRNRLRAQKLANTCSDKDFVELVSDSGFEVAGVHYYGIWPRMGRRLEWMAPYGSNYFERAWKGVALAPRLGQSFLVVARRL